LNDIWNNFENILYEEDRTNYFQQMKKSLMTLTYTKNDNELLINLGGLLLFSRQIELFAGSKPILLNYLMSQVFTFVSMIPSNIERVNIKDDVNPHAQTIYISTLFMYYSIKPFNIILRSSAIFLILYSLFWLRNDYDTRAGALSGILMNILFRNRFIS
jgi:hypothetical protein